MKKILPLLLMLNIYTLHAQKRVQFPPIQPVITDSNLKKFTDTLKAVVLRKDAQKLYTLVDARIINGFGGNDGIKNFKKQWQPEKKKDLWKVLTRIMLFGGQYTSNESGETKNKSEFVFPYFFDDQVAGVENYFELFVITGENINMRRDADIKSPVVKILSYEVVKAADSSVGESKNGWQYVKTLDGVYKGYIKEEWLHNFIDYRMFVRRKKGVWKIDVLVAGD
jgi:hypothetical protein